MTIGVMAADFASDRFRTPAGKELTITFVRHGSLAMSYDGKQIQIDPVSEYADYSAFPKADLILVCVAQGGNDGDRQSCGCRAGGESQGAGDA